MVDHVAIIKAKEAKCSVERRFLFELELTFVELPSLKNIHHCEVDKESKEDEHVDWNFDVHNRNKSHELY